MAKSNKTKRAARRFYEREAKRLVRLVGIFQPVSPDEKDALTRRYNRRVKGARRRDAKALWRKFKALYTMKPPTGDPRCPQVVRAAKIVQRAIYIKSDAMTGDEDEDDATGSDSEFPVPEGYKRGSMANVPLPDLGLGAHSEDEGEETETEDSDSQGGDAYAGDDYSSSSGSESDDDEEEESSGSGAGSGAGSGDEKEKALQDADISHVWKVPAEEAGSSPKASPPLTRL